MTKPVKLGLVNSRLKDFYDVLLLSQQFGFLHEANLDEGAMWPTAFALKELTAAEEARIAALVKKAVS